MILVTFDTPFLYSWCSVFACDVSLVVGAVDYVRYFAIFHFHSVATTYLSLTFFVFCFIMHRKNSEYLLFLLFDTFLEKNTTLSLLIRFCFCEISSLAVADQNYTKSAIAALIQVTRVQLIVDQTQ